jgi:polyhydroxyalkanoate synthase
MIDPQQDKNSSLTSKLAAPQHSPRPLTLFLEMLRSMTAEDGARRERTLAGLRAYQEAPRQAPPEPAPALDEKLGAALRDYGGSGPPLLFIPSLINPPNVLDLGPERSLLRWLSERGFRVLLLDWGWDVDARRNLSVAGHVEEIALPFISRLGEPPLLTGYCLGGTMAMAAAGLTEVRGLALIAAPWRFSGFPDEARRNVEKLWNASQPAVRALGLLPMEVLQSAFWSLDPARTVGKFERLASLAPESAEARAFVMLEDWANDGPPIPEAAAREMMEDLFGQDRTGRGEWRVGGVPVDPGRLGCPLLNIVSLTDRIVPAATAAHAGERLELEQGHVGMVVGSRAEEKLWRPLAEWLSRAAAS